MNNSLRDAIDLLGGQSAVARRFEIPYRTVQNWYRGERTPPTYVAKLITSFADDEEASHEAIDNLHFKLLDKEEELQAATDKGEEYLAAVGSLYAENQVAHSAREKLMAEATELRDENRMLKKTLEYTLEDLEEANQKCAELEAITEALQEELEKTKRLLTQKEKFVKSISHHIP